MLLALVRGFKGPGSHLRVDAWHHLYLGVVVFLLSYAAVRRPRLALVLQWIGVVLACDDALQHLVQATTGDLAFRSPLHVMYAWTYERWGWVRAMTQWLDGVFGS